MAQQQQSLIDDSQASGDDESQDSASRQADNENAEGESDNSGGDLQASAGVKPRLIPGSDATEGDLPASPQEQADLQQTVNKALYFIHGRQSRNNVLQQLHDPSGTVAQTVGRAAFNILMTVSDQKRAATGQPLDEDVLHEALGYVVPELMTVGCVAGIFPFEAPPDDSNLAPGQGNTEYDRQVKLASLEATKIYGERVLRGPGAQQRTQNAQDQWAAGIQKEVQNGTADPRFMKQIGQMRAQKGQDVQQAAANTPSDQEAAS
jgi:hypothetical protein